VPDHRHAQSVRLLRVDSMTDRLTTTDAAALIGVTPASWRKYVSDGRAPKPDGYLGRTPWWWPETVQQWQASRPGQGKGGGRPRKEKKA
jgi:hypothetical protein